MAANAAKFELDGSHCPKDHSNVFVEWRRKCGWCCSIARRSHHVRILVLAALVVVNLGVFILSSYALRCPDSRDLAGNNTASDENLQASQVFAASFLKGYEVGYFQGAHQAYSYVLAVTNACGDGGAIMQLLANAGQPNVAKNTSFAGMQGQPNVAQNMSSAGAQGYKVGYFEGGRQACNIVIARNSGVHVGALMQQDLSILAQGEPLYGFVTSMPGVQSLDIANNAPTIPNPVVLSLASAGREFINSRSEPSSRNNCNRNDVGPEDDFQNDLKPIGAPHRGNVVGNRFRSDGAKEYLGTRYHSEGVQLLTSNFQCTGVVECYLFWTPEFDMRPGCKETVCAWKCYPSHNPNLRRRVQGKNFQTYIFDEDVFAGGQNLVCQGNKCNTLPLRLEQNVPVLNHPFFGLMRLPSQVVCSWCEVAELFICANRAFKLHSGVERKEVPSKRMLVDIVAESGGFFAKPANDNNIEFEVEDQYGYVQYLDKWTGPRICVFEQCNKWTGPLSTGSVLVKRVFKYGKNGWSARVLAKDG